MQHTSRHTVTGEPGASPAHAARPPLQAARAAVLAALVLGTTAVLTLLLIRAGSTTSVPTSARSITVSPTVSAR